RPGQRSLLGRRIGIRARDPGAEAHGGRGSEGQRETEDEGRRVPHRPRMIAGKPSSVSKFGPAPGGRLGGRGGAGSQVRNAALWSRHSLSGCQPAYCMCRLEWFLRYVPLPTRINAIEGPAMSSGTRNVVWTTPLVSGAFHLRHRCVV